MAIDTDTLLALYRKLVTTREAEEVWAAMLNRQEFYLMGHFGTGQEAIGVGMGMALDLTDYLFPTHRGVAEFIGKGMSQADIWAEYMCKPAGPARGKAGCTSPTTSPACRDWWVAWAPTSPSPWGLPFLPRSAAPAR